MTAQEFIQQFKTGKKSAKEIVRETFNRIQKCDSDVNSFLALFQERAEQNAERLDAKKKSGKPLGRLAGVPIAIKDNIHVKGEYTTCASKMLEHYRAPFSATVVRFLEEEDALLIGKTNLDEFAMGSSMEHSAFKVTKNPWNLSCVPGGSSGGSAAAVAARLVPLALGTDTGGSIRQPASFTGILGFKPTYGRVSRYGLVAFGSSFDQIGPFAHSVQDIALVMEILGKPCHQDATSFPHSPPEYTKQLEAPISGMRVGVPYSFIQNLSTEAKENFEAALNTLRELGCHLIDIDLGLLKYSLAVYYILATAEASTNLARFDGIRFGKRSSRAKTLDEVYEFSKNEGLGAEVKSRILLGTYVLSAGSKDAYFKKAQNARQFIIRQYIDAFKTCALIAMPVSPFPAFPIGSIHDPLQEYLQDIYTISANLAGIPAISVPSGFSKEGKPFGLQLLGPQLEDGRVLNAAYHYDRVHQFSACIPPLFKEGV